MINEKLYYPVYAQMVYNDNDAYDGNYWSDDISQRVAANYFDEVERAVIKENQIFNDAGLMEYFWCENKILEATIKEKVAKAIPSIEIVGDEMFGVTELEMTEPLNPAEMRALKQYVLGQNSDGYGEGFEQREIKTPDGELYISFWSSDKNYYIDTQKEFETRLGLSYEQDITQDTADGPKLEM